uniref:Uncharacterized protein n=1 Tax=Peronospora matthiolae TaxID=2874970 RepID=A0AAV1ULD4_9STRA
MASSSSSSFVASVHAVEEAFLRKEWTLALKDSRRLLVARIAQRRQASREIPVMTAEEERVLSVYLQLLFEQNLDDEVDTAASVMESFAPLESRVSIQWIKFLLAMDRRLMAKQALRDFMKSSTVVERIGFCNEEYATAAEIMVLQLVLPDEGVEAAQQFVQDQIELDEETKLQLLGRIQLAYLAAQNANKKAMQSSSQVLPTAREMNGELMATDAAYPFLSPASTRTQRTAIKNDDDISWYVVMGGTAIALAVVAVGVLRYREKIRECLLDAAPAIKKGVADSKGALFDA